MLRHHLSRASRDPGRSALQAAPLRNLCVRRLPSLPRASRGLGRGAGACPELLRALDSSSLGLTLNFQLSTFNRVSFPSPSSPYLCALCALCGENSSSFRSCLMSRHSPLATNSFIIRTSETPLPQLLYNPHLQKGGGWGPRFPSGTHHLSLVTCNRIQVLLFSYTSKLFCTRQKLNPFIFIQIHALCAKHRGWGLRATGWSRFRH